MIQQMSIYFDKFHQKFFFLDDILYQMIYLHFATITLYNGLVQNNMHEDQCSK